MHPDTRHWAPSPDTLTASYCSGIPTGSIGRAGITRPIRSRLLTAPCQTGSGSLWRAAVLTPGAESALPCHSRGEHSSHCVSKTASGSLSPHEQSHIIVLAPRQPGPTGNPAWAGGEIPRVGEAVFLSNPPLATSQPGEQCSPTHPTTLSRAKLSQAPEAARMSLSHRVKTLWREGWSRMLCLSRGEPA